MGNSGSRNPHRGAGKVVFWDGKVQQLDSNNTPLTVAELMLDHPQQVVVELQSAVAGKRPRPLPADEKLDGGKVYLMLPVRRGGKPSSISAEEARRVLFIASSALSPKNFPGLVSYSGFFPLLARICTTGIGVDDRFRRTMKKIKAEKEAVAVVRKERGLPKFDLAEVLDGQPEYLSRQLSGKGWKPSLDTIVEKKFENRMPHWLF